VSSDTFFFDVRPAETVTFNLFRALTNENGNNAGIFNQFDDLRLYRVLPTGDSLMDRERVGGGGQDKVFTRALRAGRYKVMVFCEQRETFVSAYVDIPYYTLTRQITGLGIRVRQTTTRSAPTAPPLTRRYRYTVQDALGAYSSGHLLRPLDGLGEPGYASRPFTVFQNDMRPNCAPLGGAGGFGTPSCPPVYCTYANYGSTSETFGQQLNRHIWFYESVTEQALRDTVAEGQTVHRFRECREAFYDVLPTAQLRYARRDDGSFRLVNATRTAYTPVTTAVFFTLRAYQVYQLGPNMGQQTGTVTSAYEAESNAFYAAWVLPTRQTSVQYGPAGDSVSTTTFSTYRDQQLVRRRTQLNGVAQVMRYKYAADYDPALPWAAGLQAKGANPVVETQTWRLRPAVGGAPADSVLVGGAVTGFDADLCAPQVEYRLQLPQPVAGPDREPAPTAQGQYARLLSDSRYAPETTFGYENQYGNPVQVARNRAGLGVVGYVWGQRGETVLAQAMQARPSQLAYTGFEPLSAGRWQFAAAGVVPGGHTGEYAYRLEATRWVQRDALPGGEYVVTCWAPQAPALYVNGAAAPAFQTEGAASIPGGWRQWRARVAVPAGGTVSVRPPTAQPLPVDELGLYPLGAQMTAYTHQALVGTTAQADATGRTTTYEYDGLGRLLRTRDEQGRILSQQQYHYAGH
jgi:YD repeat-containing protein